MWKFEISLKKKVKLRSRDKSVKKRGSKTRIRGGGRGEILHITLITESYPFYQEALRQRARA